jgi:hypothetical protein
MQQDNSTQDWQQPNPQGSGAPFQPLSGEQLVAEPQPEQAGGPDQMIDEQATEPSEDDQAALRWQAPEYINQDKSSRWFIMFGVVVLALMDVSIFVIQAVTFTILIPVMAAALFVYMRRPAQIVDYTVSRKGVHIDDKLYTYDMFRSFSVVSHAGSHSVVLVPRKRFQMAVTAYFPEEVGEPLVDMLAARLPMQTRTPDFLDKLLARLRI